MKFPSPLLKGTLVKRYRRALADVRLDRGDSITAHVFNNGTMSGCSIPGSPVLLSDSQDKTRKHPYTWELVDVGGIWVCVNQKISRQVFTEAVSSGEILPGYRLEPEAHHSGSPRADVILHGMENNCFVTIQSVSSARGGKACFPETPAQHAHRSLERLRSVVQHGHRAVVFFHVTRADCTEMEIRSDIAPEYAGAISAASSEGVEVMAYRADVSPDGVTLGVPIPIGV